MGGLKIEGHYTPSPLLSIIVWALWGLQIDRWKVLEKSLNYSANVYIQGVFLILHNNVALHVGAMDKLYKTELGHTFGNIYCDKNISPSFAYHIALLQQYDASRAAFWFLPYWPLSVIFNLQRNEKPDKNKKNRATELATQSDK